MRAACALVLIAVPSACDRLPGRAVDTVHVVDTIVRVDTVMRSGADVLPAGAPTTDAPLTSWAIPPRDPAAAASAPAPTADAAVHLAYLRGRNLLLPVAGVADLALTDTYAEARSGGRRHDALDILAPRGTPVLSADAGRIARIDTSDRGGLSLYATDPSGGYVYYYAHLDRYRAGLRDGQALARGDTLGYVGTTGNAPPGTPHLHFGISVLGDPRRWWDGEPINPYPVLVRARR